MAQVTKAKPDASEALILDIATRHFFVETLATRNRDLLDFHDVAVWSCARPCMRHMLLATELCLNLGDALHQAARFSVPSVTWTPSLYLIPSMTFGN
jgi:hypothetical protein